jgi:hypothetical protein
MLGDACVTRSFDQHHLYLIYTSLSPYCRAFGLCAVPVRLACVNWSLSPFHNPSLLVERSRRCTRPFMHCPVRFWTVSPLLPVEFFLAP